MHHERLAARAVKAAAQVRHRCGVALDEPVCPFDLAEGLEISTRLVDLPTLEGVYVKETATILVGTQRPAGRRRYSCAHEVGHYVFGHGTRIHRTPVRLRDYGPSHSANWAEEFVANRFAEALLMPKLAVMSAFARRNWTAGKANPYQVFRIAQELGVGYGTLVAQMLKTLHVVDAASARALRRTPLRAIRRHLAGEAFDGDVVVVDQFWRRRCVDVEVGDVIVTAVEANFVGKSLHRGSDPTQIVATASGIAELRLRSGSPSFCVRVGRRQFFGLARYRHLEDEA
jgi:Zn-dependent peptidase ImmA (M78 family)